MEAYARIDLHSSNSYIGGSSFDFVGLSELQFFYLDRIYRID